MTVEQNKEIVRHLFEFQNSGDAKGAAALRAAESSNHNRKVDPALMKSVFESLNLLREHHSIHEIVAEGEWVAVRTTCKGVHAAKVRVNSGIFADVEPTGRKYTVQHMHLFRIVNGKIMEHWASRDDLGAARQVGLELKPARDYAT